MTWLIDLGNTRLKCARLLDGGGRGETRAFVHRDARAQEAIAGLLEQVDAPKSAEETVWLASVAAAEITGAVGEALRAQGFALRPVRSAARSGKLRIAYAEPTRLGVDRFLALRAASERPGGPWLIVSVGSALTVDLLDREGLHRGGLIAPTPEHMREALAARFAALDLPEGGIRNFACDSADAVASGTRGAALGLLERSLHAAEKSLGADVAVLATGGGASLMDGWRPERCVSAPDLVLEGLAIVASAAEN